MITTQPPKPRNYKNQFKYKWSEVKFIDQLKTYLNFFLIIGRYSNNVNQLFGDGLLISTYSICCYA